MQKKNYSSISTNYNNNTNNISGIINNTNDQTSNNRYDSSTNIFTYYLIRARPVLSAFLEGEGQHADSAAGFARRQLLRALCTAASFFRARPFR